MEEENGSQPKEHVADLLSLDYEPVVWCIRPSPSYTLAVEGVCSYHPEPSYDPPGLLQESPPVPPAHQASSAASNAFAQVAYAVGLISSSKLQNNLLINLPFEKGIGGPEDWST